MQIFGWEIKINKVKVKMETTDVMKANRAHLCSKDCRTAEEYLTSLIEYSSNSNSSHKVKESLMVAAIISYGRAFTTSRGDENTASEIKLNIGRAMDNDELLMSLHKTVMKNRHKAVAHSDSEFYKTKAVEIRPKGSTRESNIVGYGDDINPQLFLKLSNVMSAYFMSMAVDIDIQENI